MSEKKIDRKTMVVVCGGRSAEHEVSVRSAKAVVRALSEGGVFVPQVVGVSRSGTRYLLNQAEDLFGMTSFEDDLEDIAEPMALVRFPDKTRVLATGSGKFSDVDLIFPVTHGTFGEDGRTQGYLEILAVPYLGSSVEASVLGMNKVLSRLVWQKKGLNVLPYITLEQGQPIPQFDEVCHNLGSSFLFVKSIASGSSLGVTKVDSPQGWTRAWERAFAYGPHVMVERGLVCRELECGVLCSEDGHTLEASGIGEVIVGPQHPFYTYQAKYLDPKGASLGIPADIPTYLADTLRSMAVKACKALGIEGYARVDFFLTDTGEVFLNEINTLPGMTSISLFPRLWEYQGVSLHQCIMRLVTAALLRHQRLGKGVMMPLEDDTFEVDGDVP